MLDFRQITLFCLEKRLSKHKMAIYSKNLGGHGPFGPPLAAPMTGWNSFTEFTLNRDTTAVLLFVHIFCMSVLPGA